MEQKIPASQRTFNAYVERLLPKIVEAYGYGISSVDSMRDWYSKLSYRDEIENFLICDARTFIRSLNLKNPNNTNPMFLKKLTRKMSSYFAQYTVRSRLGYDPTQPLFISDVYKSEVRRIHRKLFDDFRYIINMKDKQQQKRAAKCNPSDPQVVKYKRRQVASARLDDMAVYRAVRAEFINAQNLGKKR